MIEVDHVILAVPSLEEAIVQLAQKFGLIGVPITADDGPIETAIVPFQNDQYLEVLALKPSAKSFALAVPLARRLARQGSHFWGFAVRTPDIRSVAARTACAVTSVDGRMVRSKTVRPPSELANQLPFFIEYLDGTGEAYLRGIRERSSEKPTGLRLSQLSLSTDPTRLANWLDAEISTLSVNPGVSGLYSIHIETQNGVVEVSYED